MHKIRENDDFVWYSFETPIKDLIKKEKEFLWQ